MWYDSRMSWDDRGERQRRCTGTGQEWQEPGRACTCGQNPPREPAEGTVRTLVTRDALGPDEVAIMSVNRLKPWRLRVCFIQLEWSIRYTIHEVVDVVVFSVYTSRIRVLVFAYTSRIQIIGVEQNSNVSMADTGWEWHRLVIRVRGCRNWTLTWHQLTKSYAPKYWYKCWIWVRVSHHYSHNCSWAESLWRIRRRTAHERVSVWDSTRGRTAHARGLCDIGEPE